MHSRPIAYEEPGSFELFCHESPVQEYPEESHRTVQICIPLAGAQYISRQHAENGRRLVRNLTERDILVLPAGQPHAIGWKRRAGVVSFQLYPEFITRSVGSDTWHVQDGLVLRDPFLLSAARDLRAELAAETPPPSAFIHAMAVTTAYRIVRGAHCNGTRLNENGAATPFSALQTRRIDSLIDDHINRPIRVSELAQLVNLSPWHFSRRFLATHGISPLAFVTRRRMDRARQMLRHERLTISDVAKQLAMSPEHLSRTFARHFGVSPQEYRRDLNGYDRTPTSSRR